MFFFFKQKTAYELRISDWSSDVCSSDLSLVFTRVSRENMCVALPIGHPYSSQECIDPQQLHGVPFIGFNAEAALYFRERIQSIFAHFQIQPVIVHESVMPTLLALVEAGMGIDRKSTRLNSSH